jgi:hypothetical protein
LSIDDSRALSALDRVDQGTLQPIALRPSRRIPTTRPSVGEPGFLFTCQVLEGWNPLFVLPIDWAFLLRFTERAFAG